MKEIERAGIPVAHITAIPTLSKQLGANRVVAGTKIPHPCGDPNLPEENDLALRKTIIETALEAIQAKVEEPTVFYPKISFTSG